jgi:hypothetical protein
VNDLKSVFAQAVQMAESGDYEEALKCFVWLHDHPLASDPSSEMFRRAFGFLAWATMGEKYPPATKKMRELLDEKIAYLKIHPDDSFVNADAGAMQQALRKH